MTIGNSACAFVVSVLILLSQGCDSRSTSSPPTDRVVSQEPVRADPAPPPEESKSPRPAEVAPPPVASPKPKPPAAVTPARPRPSRESVPPTESAPPLAPSPRAETPRPEPGPPTEPSAPRPATPATAATLDLGSLEKRLRDTKAIGVFTKLSLKNQVDDLLEEFREFHQSRDQALLAKLREAYDLLLLKVLSLLQDNDPMLARDISSSREALWKILTDPDGFKNR